MTLGAPVNTDIQNIALYNARMRKSMIDKVFFLDKVDDAEVFIDFGCADGSMLKLCQSLFPEFEYVGYDNDPDMIDAASENCRGMNLTSNFDQLLSWCEHYKTLGRKICLVFSSVIHEVYHYGPKAVDEFWQKIWSIGADFVAIREMAVSTATSRASDPVSVARIRQCYNKDRLAQWEGKWGALSENWSLVNFLLHYRYTNSWEREYRENYLPLSKEDLIALIPSNYFPDFVEHFVLPFQRRKIMEDFGIQLQDPTHLKIILRKI